MSKKIMFKGSAAALVTPFRGGKIDYKTFEKNIMRQIDEKTDALVVCGTTGECATLSDKEKISLIKSACSVVEKKIPVIAGTGSNDTRHTATLSKAAEEAGADALLVVTPYYNKTNQNGLTEHYKAICSSIELPVIIYNVPSRTGLDISIETYEKLACIPNIAAVKEASGNVVKIAEIIKRCGDELPVYSGNDELTYVTLSLGGYGVISVAANIVPFEMHALCMAYFEKKYRESLDIQFSLSELIGALFTEVNPLPVKYAMELLDLCSSEARAPLYGLSPAGRKKVEDVVSGFFAEKTLKKQIK